VAENCLAAGLAPRVETRPASGAAKHQPVWADFAALADLIVDSSRAKLVDNGVFKPLEWMSNRLWGNAFVFGNREWPE
jgi:hypothetical protein